MGAFFDIGAFTQCIPKRDRKKFTRLSTIFVWLIILVIIIIQFGTFKYSFYSIFVSEIIIVMISLLLTIPPKNLVFI
jgi:hypothetical protein